MYSNCNLFDLSHLGLIAIRGKDADVFLQGQCTNDLRQLTLKTSQLGSHNTHKGRMLAMFRLLRQANVIYLQLSKEMVAIFLERLIKYRLRSQVEINDVSTKFSTLGIAGNDADKLLNAALINDESKNIIPKHPNEVNEISPFILMRMPEQIPRLQVLGPPLQMQDLWRQLIELGGTPNSINNWKLLDVQAGIPTLYPQTVEMFVPQMVNLQMLDGISFNKGCYTGQEVIARVQHLGSLKRRLYRAEVVTSISPQPGDQLYSESSDSNQGAGNVVEACSSKNDVFEILAVVEIAAAKNNTVHLSSNNGPQLHFLDLPYTCPN